MELQSLYTAVEMRELETRAIEGLRLPSLVLMERAGMAAAAEIIRRHPTGGAATILCGAGNNGGDGFVVARHLHTAGWAVEVFLTGVSGKLKDDARTNFEIARRLDVPVHERVAPARLKRGVRRADVVVDALLGTGFTGMPRPGAAALIAAVDAAGGAVIALDVPSGVDSSTGRVEGAAVRADVTVSFHGPKLGLMVSPGRSLSGDVVVVPIGIPPQVEVPTLVGLADSRGARSRAPQGRRVDQVLGGGGARAGRRAGVYRGARARRAGRASRRRGNRVGGGAGRGLRPDRACARRGDGARAAGCPRSWSSAPGRSRSARGSAAILRRSRTRRPSRWTVRKPVVLDADGLHAVAGKLDTLAGRRFPTVLTPHEGEMAALLGETSEWVRAHRLEAVRAAARAGRRGGAPEGRRYPGRRTRRPPGGGRRRGHSRSGHGGFG